MKALVIGARGQVGSLLQARLVARGIETVGTARPGWLPQDAEQRAAVLASIPFAKNWVAVDLGKPATTRGWLQWLRPDVVFLTAALTHLDYAEDHPDECQLVNSDGPALIAESLQKMGGVLVFFSTDHVFSDASTARSEADPPAPLHAYGHSKARAEAAIRYLVNDRHLIVRTSWVYGPDRQRKNFGYRAVDTLRNQQPLTIPIDQYGNPTFGPDLAESVIELFLEGARGTYHVVGPDHLNRLEFATLIAATFGLDHTLLRGVPTAALQQRAPRPLRVRLSRDKFLRALGSDPLRGPRAALEAWRDGPPAECP